MATLRTSFLMGSSLFLQVQLQGNDKRVDEFEFRSDLPLITELNALECMKKALYNVVATLASSFLTGSS